MKTAYQILFFVSLAAMLTACVPQRKFLDAQRDARQAKQQYEACKSNLESAQATIETQDKQLVNQGKQIKELEIDTTLRGQRYRSITALNREMERLYKEIQAQNQALVANASSEKIEMSEALALTQADLKRKERELEQKERELLNLKNELSLKQQNIEGLQIDLDERGKKMDLLEADLQARTLNIERLQNDLQARETRVNELEAAINSQEQIVSGLKDRLNQALRGFSASELTVEEKDGKVYVSLSQQLLFASGSKTIDSKGKRALKTLAEVLNKNTDIDIIIEGHTDNVGEASSNWDLSVLRATSIVKELAKNAVTPERIVASGRGEHIPKVSNDTSTGKAENRRTEIILSPKLDELYRILNN